MVDRIKKYAKIVSERDGFFMFLRAQLSSQLATIIDFIITIGLAKLFSVYYVYATFAGSFFGGIVNCIVNYKWTFRPENCKKINIVINKFSISHEVRSAFSLGLSIRYMDKFRPLSCIHPSSSHNQLTQLRIKSRFPYICPLCSS